MSAADPLTAALNLGGQIIDRVWENPAEREKARLSLLELAQRGDLAQLSVNQAEAANASVFVSGWRPAIGWICGAACAWNWIGLPVAVFGASLLGVTVSVRPADLSEMFPILLGMLGLGGLRTVEKIKGVAAS